MYWNLLLEDMGGAKESFQEYMCTLSDNLTNSHSRNKK